MRFLARNFRKIPGAYRPRAFSSRSTTCRYHRSAAQRKCGVGVGCRMCRRGGVGIGGGAARIAQGAIGRLGPQPGRHHRARAGKAHGMVQPAILAHMRHVVEGEAGIAPPGMADPRLGQFGPDADHRVAQAARGLLQGAGCASRPARPRARGSHPARAEIAVPGARLHHHPPPRREPADQVGGQFLGRDQVGGQRKHPRHVPAEIGGGVAVGAQDHLVGAHIPLARAGEESGGRCAPARSPRPARHRDTAPPRRAHQPAMVFRRVHPAMGGKSSPPK